MASSSSSPHQVDPDHVYKLFLGYNADELLGYLESFPRAERFGKIKYMAKRLQSDLKSGLDINEDKHRRDALIILEMAHEAVNARSPPPRQTTRAWLERNIAIGVEVPSIISITTVAAPEHPNDEAAGPIQNPEAPEQHELGQNAEAGVQELNNEAVVPVIQNTEAIDLRGTIAAEVNIPAGVSYVFRVNVHAVMADDFSTGYAGVSFNVNGQYVSAGCRSVPGLNLANVFASACAAVVRVGYMYAQRAHVPLNTVLVILESAQVHLLQTIGSSPEVQDLRHELSHTRNRLSRVPFLPTSAVFRLALYARRIRLDGVLAHPDLPDWASDLFGGFG